MSTRAPSSTMTGLALSLHGIAEAAASCCLQLQRAPAAADTIVETIQSGVSVLLPEDELQVRASAVVAVSVSPEVIDAAKRRA
jgi:hypothetical protein